MTAWDELKPVLARLRDQQPGVLARYPSLDPGLVVRTPISVHLAPWAADAAEDLRRQFGSDVELTVGFLPYPPGRPVPPRRRRAPGQLPDLLDPREVAAALDGPATVSSGRTLHHRLSVRNLAASDLQVATGGHVTASVVDPRTGETVGGFSGARTLPLKVFRVIPGATVQIPLLIGTASSAPRLGYTVPAGEWGIQVTLELGPGPRDSPRRRTPVLPLTITA